MPPRSGPLIPPCDRRHDGDTRFAALIPFYWHLRKPEHETRVVLPLYYGARGPTDTTKVLTLWYR
jgi:hypothetical protein